jgi:hypothetical protein
MSIKQAMDCIDFTKGALRACGACYSVSKSVSNTRHKQAKIETFGKRF